ncbi:universal stress protein [Pedobacter chinensis]|uniref:Universal stress protein n=1 Tax=Pedobacter chinensis TaxID=2282421 RepID=A0A369PSN7_9SPHI|nr:universal stress protein [Pedobacter chinensis]RDC55270.1 universal stress protein [Pedobacter chinensis]
MKTILVPTDFSKAADNAVEYAINLAKIFKSKLLLANAVSVPIPVVTPAGIDIPFEGSEEIRMATINELHELKDKSHHQDLNGTDPSSTFPEIEVAAGFGPPYVYLSKLVRKTRAGLVIAGLSGAGGMRRFFMGSTSRDLINVAGFPVLLIPQDVTFKGGKQIVFASDLSMSDVKIIKYLAGMAKQLGAEIKIAHIVADTSTLVSDKVGAFMQQLKTIVYEIPLSCQSVYNRGEEEGFEWLMNHMKIDWFVMVHRNHGFWSNILKESYCQKMARQTLVPILVVPENYHPND